MTTLSHQLECFTHNLLEADYIAAIKPPAEIDHSCAGELLSNLKYFKWLKGVDVFEDASISVNILEKLLMGVVIGIDLHTVISIY